MVLVIHQSTEAYRSGPKQLAHDGDGKDNLHAQVYSFYFRSGLRIILCIALKLSTSHVSSRIAVGVLALVVGPDGGALAYDLITSNILTAVRHYCRVGHRHISFLFSDLRSPLEWCQIAGSGYNKWSNCHTRDMLNMGSRALFPEVPCSYNTVAEAGRAAAALERPDGKRSDCRQLTAY
ncbi:hypothetical protein NUW58_g4561 [Xylaria curta]|uniref:Uncharacterized protein n=1 Tax=Xylaria curta TaxID=42375 RepID=A0ACC1P7H7_9PEZI|nr:hypothetical protein NUW58_g4561 [Xylaria curta]